MLLPPYEADCCVLALTESSPTSEIVFLNGSFVLWIQIKRNVVSFPQSVTKSFINMSQMLLAKPSNETVLLINNFTVDPAIRCWLIQFGWDYLKRDLQNIHRNGLEPKPVRLSLIFQVSQIFTGGGTKANKSHPRKQEQHQRRWDTVERKKGIVNHCGDILL